jgi:hypothetical protein
MTSRKSSIDFAAATMTPFFSKAQSPERDALDQDGITHQAFDMAWEDYADALTINTPAFVSFASSW